MMFFAIVIVRRLCEHLGPSVRGLMSQTVPEDAQGQLVAVIAFGDGLVDLVMSVVFPFSGRDGGHAAGQRLPAGVCAALWDRRCGDAVHPSPRTYTLLKPQGQEDSRATRRTAMTAAPAPCVRDAARMVYGIRFHVHWSFLGPDCSQ